MSRRRSRRSRHPAPSAGPNLLPVVNVAMVVLIVFMIGASFAGPEWYLRSNLPFRPTGGGAVQLPEDWVPDEPLDVYVDPVPGEDRFVARVGDRQAGNLPGLIALLTEKRDGLAAANRPPDAVRVQISPSRQLAYRHLLAVYEAALEAGFGQVAFTTAR